MDKKSVGGGVVGIIGAVFALLGGIGLALCAEIVDGASDLATGGSGTNYAVFAWIFGIGAAVIGLIGAVLCFKKAMVGGIMQIVAVVLILVGSIIVAFTVLNIIAMILLAVGAILAFVMKK